VRDSKTLSQLFVQWENDCHEELERVWK